MYQSLDIPYASLRQILVVNVHRTGVAELQTQSVRVCLPHVTHRTPLVVEVDLSEAGGDGGVGRDVLILDVHHCVVREGGPVHGCWRE